MKLRKLLSIFMVSGLLSLVLAWAGTSSWGDDPPPPSSGDAITGVIPKEAPDNLSVEELEKISEALPPSWQEWGQTTTDLILDFYESDYPSLQAQRQALDALQRRVKTMERTLNESAGKYNAFPQIRENVNRLYSRLKTRVDLAEAVIDTLTMDPLQARPARMSSAINALSNSLSRFDSDMNRVNHGQPWRDWVNYVELRRIASSNDSSDAALLTVANVKNKLAKRETFEPAVRDFISRGSFLDLEDALQNYLDASIIGTPEGAAQFKKIVSELVAAVEGYIKEPTSEKAYEIRRLDGAIRRNAPDGGHAIMAVLTPHFYNYNLRVSLSEGLLRRLISDSRQEGSWINEHVMEAYVRGYQCTNANLTVDFLPSSNGARMMLQLNGTIQSNANGYTNVATVQTVGNHSFHASKEVTFDGNRFITAPVNVQANANNQTVGVSTKYSRIPILGRIADRIAMREAQSRTGQTNYLTANKIHQEVGTRLNSEVDDQFAKASMEIQNKMYGPLRERGLYPGTMLVDSTDLEMRLRSRLMESDELGGSSPLFGTGTPMSGLLIQVHESLLTNGVERLGLNGKTMTEDEVRAHLQRELSAILGRQINVPPTPTTADSKPNTFIFSNEDAVRFSIVEGKVRLIIRAGLKREGADAIPEHIIEVPLNFSVQGNQIRVFREEKDQVAVRAATDLPDVSNAEKLVRANIMRQTIQSALPDQTFDAGMNIEQGGKSIPLTITDIDVATGWINFMVN